MDLLDSWTDDFVASTEMTYSLGAVDYGTAVALRVYAWRESAPDGTLDTGDTLTLGSVSRAHNYSPPYDNPIVVDVNDTIVATCEGRVSGVASIMVTSNPVFVWAVSGATRTAFVMTCTASAKGSFELYRLAGPHD